MNGIIDILGPREGSASQRNVREQGTIISVVCCCLVAVISDFCDSIACSPLSMEFLRLLCPWSFSDKNTGVDCYSLLQGIFLTQGSNSNLLHWQADSLPLGHQGSPSVLWQEAKCMERKKAWSETGG